MEHYTYMRDLLRPLCLYDLETGIGASELRAIGAQLDTIFAQLEEIERESLVETACDRGLVCYEDILPYRPISNTVEERRAAIGALIRIDSRSFTLQALTDTLAGCGMTVDLMEMDTPMTVQVSFPQYRGIPPEIEKLKVRVEAILPCHLDVLYHYFFLIWDELMAWFHSWNSLEALGLNWAQLEAYEE
jgi:hypothetical protein